MSRNRNREPQLQIFQSKVSRVLQDNPLGRYKIATRNGDTYKLAMASLQAEFPHILDDSLAVILYKLSLFKKLRRAIAFGLNGFYFVSKGKKVTYKYEDIESFEENVGNSVINGQKVVTGPGVHESFLEFYTKLAGKYYSFSELMASPIFLPYCISCRSQDNLKKKTHVVEGDYELQSISKYSVGAVLMGAPWLSMIIENLREQTKERMGLFNIDVYYCQRCYGGFAFDGAVVISGVDAQKGYDCKDYRIIPERDRLGVWIRNEEYAEAFFRTNTEEMPVDQALAHQYREGIAEDLSSDELHTAHIFNRWCPNKNQTFLEKEKAEKIREKYGLNEPVLFSLNYGWSDRLICTTKQLIRKEKDALIAVKYGEFTSDMMGEIAAGIVKHNGKSIFLVLARVLEAEQKRTGSAVSEFSAGEN